MDCASLRFWLAVALGASATCSRCRGLLMFLHSTLHAGLSSRGCQVLMLLWCQECASCFETPVEDQLQLFIEGSSSAGGSHSGVGQ